MIQVVRTRTNKFTQQNTRDQGPGALGPRYRPGVVWSALPARPTRPEARAEADPDSPPASDSEAAKRRPEAAALDPAPGASGPRDRRAGLAITHRRQLSRERPPISRGRRRWGLLERDAASTLLVHELVT